MIQISNNTGMYYDKKVYLYANSSFLLFFLAPNLLGTFVVII